MEISGRATRIAPAAPAAGSSRQSSIGRAVGLAIAASLLPVASAFAQSPPLVRVTEEESEIRTFLSEKHDVLMTAARGTLLEMIYTEGDKYQHRESNWYWVLLPRDSWGTRRAGWISGRDVEQVPPAEPVKTAPAPIEAPEPPPAAAPPVVEAPPPVAAAAAPPVEPIADVILNFEFAKSDLSDEARGKLAAVVALLQNGGQASFTIEGHADWIGREPYNEKLGLARAEAVKRHLAEQYQIPADQICVATFGETQPAASNATPEGRAQNRRVVVKIAR